METRYVIKSPNGDYCTSTSLMRAPTHREREDNDPLEGLAKVSSWAPPKPGEHRPQNFVYIKPAPLTGPSLIN